MNLLPLLLCALLTAGGGMARAGEAATGGMPAGTKDGTNAGAVAGTAGTLPNADWTSYRDAYRTMIRFEKYGKPKQLIQSHFRVMPKDEGVSLEGVHLILTSPSVSLNLLLDAAGRAVFPFLKSAFDENARLQLNRSGNRYLLRQAVSIIPRADGIYETADLQAACEQVLAYLRDSGKAGMQDRKCSGVRFAYPRQAEDPLVFLRTGESRENPLPVEDAVAFDGDAGPVFKTVTYRFPPRPDKAQVHTQQRPIAITAVFD